MQKSEQEVQSEKSEEKKEVLQSPETTRTTEDVQNTTYLTLRHRKIYRTTGIEQQQELDLSKYLENFVDKVRESDRNLLPGYDALDKKLEETRKNRLKAVEKLKQETINFRKSLKEFQGLPYSIASSNNIEYKTQPDNFVKPTDFVLSWLENSIEQESDIVSPLSTENMATDYAKIVKLTTQLVPVFSGELHHGIVPELQTFLGCCNQALKCLKSTDHDAFLEIIKTRLRGEAYRLVNCTQINTFKELETLLNRTFLPRETYQESVNKLINCQQKLTESFTQFTTRVKYLLALGKEAADSKYNSNAANIKTQLTDLAISTIKNGTQNLQLKQYLLTIEENDIEKLTQKALDMERLLLGQTQTYLGTNYPFNSTPTYSTHNINNNLTPNYSYNNNLIPNITPVTPNYYPVLNQNQPLSNHNHLFNNITQNPNFPNQKTSQLPKINCSFCKRKGHTYDECYKRKNTPHCTKCNRQGHDARDCRSRNFSPTQNNNPPGAKINHIRTKCDFCGRLSHSVNECYQKRKWENKNSGNGNGSTQNPPSRS